jgi:hypothetical protein
MGALPLSSLCLWAFSIIAQLVVCALLLGKGHFRKLPIVTTYVSLNLFQAIFLFTIYLHLGFGAASVPVFFWSSQVITLAAQALATVELLHKVLNPYPGIWGLAWRLLALAFSAVICYSVIESGRNLSWLILVADRGFHFAFAVALVACLLLVRYYSIVVPSIYKVFLSGFCFYSCWVVLKNTVFQALFMHLSHLSYYQQLWDAATLLPFIILQLSWAVALRNFLPVSAGQTALLPISVYQQISPAINFRLRLLNEQLSQLWKMETPRS